MKKDKKKKIKKDSFVCIQCGSKKVQMHCWVDPNTGKGLGEVPFSRDWCRECNSYTLVINKLEYNLLKNE